MFFWANQELDLLEKAFIILTNTSLSFIYKRTIPYFQCACARLRKIWYVIAINYYLTSYSPRNLTLGKNSAYITLLPSDVSPYLAQFYTWKQLIFFGHAHSDASMCSWTQYYDDWENWETIYYFLYASGQPFFIFNEGHWWWKYGSFRNAYKYWIFVKVRSFREYIFPCNHYMMTWHRSLYFHLALTPCVICH